MDFNNLSDYASVQGHTIEIQSKNKCDLVMDKIMELIASGEYNPGDKLPPENFFTESFNVSRVTIRESFKKLSSMGIVTVKQGQGTFVNKITPSTFMAHLYPLMMMNQSDLGQIYDARIHIEGGIAELAAQSRTQEDIDKMKALIPLMMHSVDNAMFSRYNELDMELHTLIGNAAKNDILLTVYKILNEVRKKGIYISNSSVEALKESIEAHKKIIDAIERQDAETSRTTMIEHIQFSRNAATKKLGSEI